MCLPVYIFRQRINNRAWYLRHSCTHTQKVKKFKASRDIHVVGFVSCSSVVNPKKYRTGHGNRKNSRYLYLFFITRINSGGFAPLRRRRGLRDDPALRAAPAAIPRLAKAAFHLAEASPAAVPRLTEAPAPAVLRLDS